MGVAAGLALVVACGSQGGDCGGEFRGWGEGVGGRGAARLEGQRVVRLARACVGAGQDGWDRACGGADAVICGAAFRGGDGERGVAASDRDISRHAPVGHYQDEQLHSIGRSAGEFWDPRE